MSQSDPGARLKQGAAAATASSQSCAALADEVVRAAAQGLARLAVLASACLEHCAALLISDLRQLHDSCVLVSSLCDAVLGSLRDDALPEEGARTLAALVDCVARCNAAVRRFLEPGRPGTHSHTPAPDAPAITSVLRATTDSLRLADTCLLSDRYLQAVGPELGQQACGTLRGMVRDDLGPVLAAVAALPAAWPAPGGGGDASAEAHANAGPALLRLHAMAAAAADVIAGRHGASGVQQLRSFATLNALWVALVAALASAHASVTDALARGAVPGAPFTPRVMSHVLGLLADARTDYLASGSDAHVRVMRFWMQHYFRLAAAHPAAAALAFPALSSLAAAASCPPPSSPSSAAVDLHATVARVVGAKLLPSVTAALAAAPTPALLRHCTRTLAGAVEAAPAPHCPGFTLAADALRAAASDAGPAALAALVEDVWGPIWAHALAASAVEPSTSANGDALAEASPVARQGEDAEAGAGAGAASRPPAVRAVGALAAAARAAAVAGGVAWDAVQRQLFRTATSAHPAAPWLLVPVWRAGLGALPDDALSRHACTLASVLLSAAATEAVQPGAAGPRQRTRNCAAVLAGLLAASRIPATDVPAALAALIPASDPVTTSAVSPHALAAAAALIACPDTPLAHLPPAHAARVIRVALAAAGMTERDSKGPADKGGHSSGASAAVMHAFLSSGGGVAPGTNAAVGGARAAAHASAVAVGTAEPALALCRAMVVGAARAAEGGPAGAGVVGAVRDATADMLTAAVGVARCHGSAGARADEAWGRAAAEALRLAVALAQLRHAREGDTGPRRAADPVATIDGILRHSGTVLASDPATLPALAEAVAYSSPACQAHARATWDAALGTGDPALSHAATCSLTLLRHLQQAEFKSLAPSRLWDSGSAEPRAPTFKRTLAAHLRRIASRGAQPSDAPDAEAASTHHACSPSATHHVFAGLSQRAHAWQGAAGEEARAGAALLRAAAQRRGEALDPVGRLEGAAIALEQSLASGVGWAGAEGGAEGAWARLQDAVRRAERAGSGLRAAAEAGAA